MKKALINLLITISSGLVLIAVLVVVGDPFFHYHSANKEGAFLFNEIYQTPGMARHYSYDTIIMGTSMTENFQIDWFTEYGESAVKLCYSGARIGDIISLMEQAYASENEIKHIYVDINDYQLSEAWGKRFGNPPEYLYDDNPLTDVQYIYNKDVVIAAIDRLMSFAHPNDNMVEGFTWTDETLFGREQVLADIEGEREGQEWVSDEEDASVYLECASKNMNELCEYIDNHPQTQFTLFYPPYSAVYWWDLSHRGQLDSKIRMYELSLHRLMQCDNADVYFFMDDYDIIRDLNRYRDMCHYEMGINRYMLECMQQERDKISEDEIGIRLEALSRFAEEYEP